MTLVDFVFLGILLLFAVGGVMRGIVGEIFALLAVFAAIWTGVRHGAVMAPFVAGMVDDPAWRNGIAALVAGFLAWIVVIIIGRFVNNAVGKSFLSGINRFFGLLFGVGRALVLVGFATLVAGTLNLLQGDWWQKAATKPLAEHSAQVIGRFIDVKGFVADQLLEISDGPLGSATEAMGDVGKLTRKLDDADPAKQEAQEP